MFKIHEISSKIMKTYDTKLVKKIPGFVINKLLIYRGLKNPGILYKAIKELNILFHDVSAKDNLRINNYIDWQKAFKKYIWSFPQNIELVRSFIQCDLKPMKVNHNINKKGVTLICVVKNDLERMKMLYEHHRNIGITHFVILDNDSNDGTLEWVLEQSDTDVYLVTEKFTSLKKYGWINRIIDIYGFDKWYLYVDSDELFVYNDYENKSIEDLIKYCEKKRIYRLSSLMIDMYSKDGIFKTNASKESIKEKYRYFDTNSYSETYSYKGIVIRGGPRKRVMASNQDWLGPILTKHPLFFFQKGNIFESAHYIYPFINKSGIESALLHYKFLESDLIRYAKIATQGNFSRGSLEYKKYIKAYEKNKDLTFIYNGSTEFEGSQSLKLIDVIKPIIWRD